MNANKQQQIVDPNTSAFVSAIIRVAPRNPDPSLPYAQRFPETAAVLAGINARHEELRVAALNKTKEGRIELAKITAARISKGPGKRAATDANKLKRATEREMRLAEAQRKKAEQASQGRGGGGSDKKKGK